MIKLPNQFEARSRHSTESAAAGGSTCSTCSCCLVTLGVSSVLTSMHFHTLPKVALRPKSEPGSKPEPSPDPTATEHKARPADGTGPSVLGFFLPLLTLIAGGLGMMSGSFVLAAILGFGAWGGIWSSTYGNAGRTASEGFWLSVLAFAGLVGMGAVEVMLWLNH